MKITIDEVMSWDPCAYYTRDRILHVSGGREEIETAELVDLDIPFQDLLWVVSTLLPMNDSFMLAAAFAESVLHLVEREWPSQRTKEMIMTARLYGTEELIYTGYSTPGTAVNLASCLASYAVRLSKLDRDSLGAAINAAEAARAAAGTVKWVDVARSYASRGYNRNYDAKNQRKIITYYLTQKGPKNEN